MGWHVEDRQAACLIADPQRIHTPRALLAASLFVGALSLYHLRYTGWAETRVSRSQRFLTRSGRRYIPAADGRSHTSK
jgi:hypothetical protein